MPFDTSGTFNRVIEGGWQADAAAGTKITAVRHDAEDDGFAAGLSDCINKWGYTQPQAHLPMNNKKITNLGEPDDPSDAATRNYVDTFKSFTTGKTRESEPCQVCPGKGSSVTRAGSFSRRRPLSISSIGALT